MQGFRVELPQREAAEGNEEIGFVELAELDAEAVVFDQEGITALGAIGRQQEFLATKPDGQGATNLGLAQGIPLDGQLLVVERTIWQWREVIRALDGVMTVDNLTEAHGVSA